jgi:hypothetical protein
MQAYIVRFILNLFSLFHQKREHFIVMSVCVRLFIPSIGFWTNRRMYTKLISVPGPQRREAGWAIADHTAWYYNGLIVLLKHILLHDLGSGGPLVVTFWRISVFHCRYQRAARRRDAYFVHISDGFRYSSRSGPRRPLEETAARRYSLQASLSAFFHLWNFNTAISLMLNGTPGLGRLPIVSARRDSGHRS